MVYNLSHFVAPPSAFSTGYFAAYLTSFRRIYLPEAGGLFHVHIKVVGEVGQEYGNIRDLLGNGFAAFGGNGGQVGIGGPPYVGCAPSARRLPPARRPGPLLVESVRRLWNCGCA